MLGCPEAVLRLGEAESEEARLLVRAPPSRGGRGGRPLPSCCWRSGPGSPGAASGATAASAGSSMTLYQARALELTRLPLRRAGC